jgi:hypothetical protein
MGNKRTVKNTYFDESRMLIYDLNAQARGRQSGARFCATMSEAIAQKRARLWLSGRASQRQTARVCYAFLNASLVAGFTKTETR